jgi:hypothetical protein
MIRTIDRPPIGKIHTGVEYVLAAGFNSKSKTSPAHTNRNKRYEDDGNSGVLASA